MNIKFKLYIVHLAKMAQHKVGTMLFKFLTLEMQHPNVE